MDQLHKRFTAEQVKVLLKGYDQGSLTRADVQEVLGVGKTRFFALLKQFQQEGETFTLEYHRQTPKHLSSETEEAIQQALMLEKELVEDPQLPISTYNYSAMRDRLKEKGHPVSATTITKRAKTLDCYIPARKHKTHTREVITAAPGALIQHDASTHQWSPYANEKWVLITSIDDFSRKLLFADFFEQESTWAHISAAQTLFQTYGTPVRYYVDNLRVFRFVQKRDSFWRNHKLLTDEVDPQWRQVMRAMGVDVTYALSPQAKGKVERPYRWLQDRIVRTCALEKLTTIQDGRQVLRAELARYNDHQVHATTGEIPSIRFQKAQDHGNSLFRPFVLPKPYTSIKDVFCLRDTRTVNGYQRIAIFDQQIRLPNVPLREDVILHIIPDFDRQIIELRIWWQDKLVSKQHLPLPKQFTFNV